MTSDHNKYLLKMPNGRMVPFNTYQSRAEDQWVAWHPITVERYTGEWWAKLILRLAKIKRVTHHVDSTQRRAAVGLAKELGAVLYTADGRTVAIDGRKKTKEKA